MGGEMHEALRAEQGLVEDPDRIKPGQARTWWSLLSCTVADQTGEVAGTNYLRAPLQSAAAGGLQKDRHEHEGLAIRRQ